MVTRKVVCTPTYPASANEVILEQTCQLRVTERHHCERKEKI